MQVVTTVIILALKKTTAEAGHEDRNYNVDGTEDGAPVVGVQAAGGKRDAAGKGARSPDRVALGSSEEAGGRT